MEIFPCKSFAVGCLHLCTAMRFSKDFYNACLVVTDGDSLQRCCVFLPIYTVGVLDLRLCTKVGWSWGFVCVDNFNGVGSKALILELGT